MDGKVAFMDKTTINLDLKLVIEVKYDDSAYNDQLQHILIDVEFMVPNLRISPTASSQMPLLVDNRTRCHDWGIYGVQQSSNHRRYHYHPAQIENHCCWL